MNCLIIGGYGTFGQNIAKLLAGEAGLICIIAGRNIAKAQMTCTELSSGGGGAIFEPLRLDRTQPLAPQIENTPNIIIDATGPFQAFRGAAAKIVIEYALDHKCHYLDLSDDTEFIRIIETFNIAAIEAGIIALSGLSSYPALTAAVLDMLKKQVPKPIKLSTSIAPSPQARLGQNVLAAILSAAGRKLIYARKGGEVMQTYGLLGAARRVIAPPLEKPLKALIFAQVDSPEAVLLDAPSLIEIKNYAGPQPVWMMRLLIFFSYLARFKLFPPLRIFTKIFHRLHTILTFGEHRSGYFVHIENETQQADFHLTADGDDGPLIPSMPAAIIVKNLLSGQPMSAGARSGAGAVTFQDYDRIFSQLNIEHGSYISRINEAASLPVYKQFLKNAFNDLPAEIQSLHDIDTEKIFEGRADIIRGKNPLGAIICFMFGFPKAGRNIKAQIRRVPLGDNLELWERRFNGRKMRSTQAAGRGKHTHMIIEKFGPLAVQFAYYKRGDKYYVDTQGWKLFGLPMPKFLCPGGQVYEQGKNGKFHFHVELCVPFIGMVVKYIGWFDPKPRIKTECDQKNLS